MGDQLAQLLYMEPDSELMVWPLVHNLNCSLCITPSSELFLVLKENTVPSWLACLSSHP